MKREKRQKKRTEVLKTHFCEKYAYEIRQLCRPGQYNIVCHKHLGDVFYQVAMKEQFERRYGAKLHYVIRPEHQFLMEMFSVENYSLYDFGELEREASERNDQYMPWTAHRSHKFEVVCKDLLPCVPLKGEPFIPDGDTIHFFMWDHYWSKVWAYNAGLESQDVSFPIPHKMMEMSENVKRALKTLGVTFRWTVLFAPDATTAVEIPVEIWNALADHIHGRGYKIIVNSTKYKIKHGMNLNLSLRDVVALGQRCEYVFSLRSGLCDVLVGMGNRLYAFYPAMLRREFGGLTKPFAEPTKVNEIQFYEWKTSPLVWEGEELTPLLQHELDKLRRNWQRENRRSRMSRGEKRRGHIFWRNIFRDVAKKPTFYPENNVENPPPDNTRKKVSLLGVPVYERVTDIVTGITRKTLLGGLWHERRVGKCKKICVCGLQVYSRNKRRKKVLGITLQRYDYEGLWLRSLAQRVGDEYDDVYLFRHDMGETYVELAHLEERAKAYGSVHPLVVAREKKYEDVCRMLLPDGIAVRYISLKQDDIHWVFREQGKDDREVMVEAEGHRFFCSTPHIAEHMLELMRKENDVNFYRYICESTGVQPLTTKLPVPRVAPEDVARVRQVQERNELVEGKYVVLLPEARAMEMLDMVFWQSLSAEFEQRGYGVYTNRTDRESDHLPVGALLELCRCATGLVTMGSGMAVLLTSVGRQMDLIYTPLRLTKGRKCDADKVMQLYSVHHLPGIDRQRVREYDGSKLKPDELAEQILGHY